MKEKKLFLSVYAVLFLAFSANSYVLADNASKKELFFGPIVSGIKGTGLLASKSQGSGASLDKTSLGGGEQEILHFSLDISRTSLKTVRSKDYVKIDGLKPYGNPGEPQLPFKSFVVTLPLNSTVSAVNVGNVSYRSLLNKLDIVAHPMLVARRTKNQKQTAEIQEGAVKIRKGNPSQSKKSYSQCKTCNAESFFPGNLVSYDTGKDNENRYVFVKFFPMQYISGTGQAMLITSADITVNYQLTDNK